MNQLEIGMIWVRECKQCGWATRHPSLRWCGNCGSKIEQVQMAEREYYERAYRFHCETGWEWANASFDPRTGKPFGKEQE